MNQLLIYLFLGAAINGYGQVLKAEFVAMNDYIETLENYRLNVSYSAGDGEGNEDGMVSVIVAPKGLFYNLGSEMIMVNNNNTILIDQNEKALIYSDNQKLKGKNTFSLSDQLIKGIDTLVTRCDSITFYQNNGIRTYNLRFKNAYFDLVQLEFSKKILSRITYYYNETFVDQAGVTAICNVDLEENITIDPVLFQTNYYLLEQGGIIVPSENFNNYLIIYNEAIESIID